MIEASLAEGAIVNCCLDQRGTEGSFLVSNLHVTTAEGQLVQAAHHHASADG